MLTKDQRALVHATIKHATETHDGAAHTVAGALLTQSKEIVLGLNAYHFLGGPCGEVSALSNHAANFPNDPVTTVVAAYGPTASVIAPCGKCRQILYDLNPNIECIIRTANGLEAQSIDALLPHAYDWKEMEAPQRLYMWEGYESVIRAGDKSQTIRIDDPFRPGPALLVFEKESGKTLTIEAVVEQVETKKRKELDAKDAELDGFENLEALHSALDQHYPGLSDDDPVEVVQFRITA